jgi:YD repeat-containing protein
VEAEMRTQRGSWRTNGWRVLDKTPWAAGAVVALASAVAQASGVDPTKISLPKGPGSIEGLASADFSPSLSTGAASYEIQIAVPPGSAGFGPKLGLSYDSGSGASEIAIGWRISGLPKLRRRTEDGVPRFDETDRFELVGIGIPSELVEVAPGTFRPTYEDGSFVRLQRSEDGSVWEARTKAGLTLRFGGASFLESEGDLTSAYLLREELDRHGHRIAYEWDTSEGHALVTKVVWNDFDAASKNEVLFEYERRPDRHRRLSNGILETVTRRLHSVHVRHGGALVRRYELSYGEEIHPSLLSVGVVGRDGASRLPESRFEYTKMALTTKAADVVEMTNAPGLSPKEPDATLADLNGDGLPDLLLARAGQFRSYMNHDGARWLDPSDWGSASPSVSLSEKGVEMADLDADGAPDLVVKSGVDTFRYFPRPSGTRFDVPVSIARVPSFSFEDQDVRLADMDGDRRADVVVTTDSGIAVGYNRGGTDWTEPELIAPIDPLERLLFSNGRTSLCDMNGDRIEDVCSLRPGSLSYWLGRGRGRFEPAEVAQRVPDFDESAPYRLVDLNGDGWVDLVRVQPKRVEFAVSVAEGRFAEVQSIEDTPPLGPLGSVHFADMNGSGTTDIVWVDTTNDDRTSWRYLELFPNGRAGLLERIDNGLGKVQTIEYEPAALHAARSRDSGRPWAARINVAMPVVARVRVDLSIGDPLVVTELAYHDGAYDPVGRTFAGFGGCTRREIGDESTPTLVSESTFDTGLTHRERRGMPLIEFLHDDYGVALSRTTRGYTSRTLATSQSGQAVGYSYASSELVEYIEGKSRPSRSVLTEFEQDDHGNVVEERRWGEIAGSDYLVGNDEALVERTVAENDDEWLLGYVATERITDGRGRRVSFTRRYYDGPEFEGLPLGEVSRGDVSREEAWAGPDENAFDLVVATKYDADGLPVETRDGAGGGRRFAWAPDRTSIASEQVKIDSGVVLIERATVDGAFGALLSATDYAGNTTNYEYDAFGRLAKVIKPGDSISRPSIAYAYEPGARLSRIVTEARVRSGADDVDRSETLVDGSGRERGTLTRDGGRWILAGVSVFDARGNARRSLLPRGVSRTEYASPPLLDASPRGSDTLRDALGREVHTRSPTGIETRTEYGPLESRHWDGGQANETSPYEHTPTVERKDGLGRIVAHERTLDGKQFVTAYSYDPSGALVRRTDPEGHVARYEYDGRGRRIVVHDPDLGDTRFTYDSGGNLVARAYPDGVTARFSFDSAGRSLTEDWDGDGVPELTRTWDVAPNGDGSAPYRGKLARVTEPSGSVEHTYDERGRVTSTKYDIDGSIYVVRSEFDAQDREILHVYPDGSSIEIGRNPRGQVESYGDAITLDYADDGIETARRFSTGVRVDSGYDDERRRTELIFTARDGSTTEHLRWTYDSGGNVTAVTDLRTGIASERDRSETYTYDNLYRLSKASGAWGTTSYRFSPSGNLLGRTSSVSGQSLGNVAYGERPHLPASADGRTVESDVRGRVTNDGSRAFTWNHADQLVAVSRKDGGSVENTFGDDGVRRIRVERGADGRSSTTHFIDGWAEAKDGKLARYIVHGGQRIVRLADDNGVIDGSNAGAPARPSWNGGAPAGGRRNHDPIDARAATPVSLGAICLFAFALTAVLRILFRRGNGVERREPAAS